MRAVLSCVVTTSVSTESPPPRAPRQLATSGRSVVFTIVDLGSRDPAIEDGIAPLAESAHCS